jgi:hypothetical protein
MAWLFVIGNPGQSLAIDLQAAGIERVERRHHFFFF